MQTCRDCVLLIATVHTRDLRALADRNLSWVHCVMCYWKSDDRMRLHESTPEYLAWSSKVLFKPAPARFIFLSLTNVLDGMLLKKIQLLVPVFCALLSLELIGFPSYRQRVNRLKNSHLTILNTNLFISGPLLLTLTIPLLDTLDRLLLLFILTWNGHWMSVYNSEATSQQGSSHSQPKIWPGSSPGCTSEERDLLCDGTLYLVMGVCTGQISIK